MLENSKNIMAIILAGSRGSRLHPLTRNRVTQSIPLVGQQRLIDISINNCVKSGIHRILILSQSHLVPLSSHILRTYSASVLHNRQIEILADENELYQGTADGLRKQIHEIVSSKEDLILVIPGDDICEIDFAELANYHKEHNADITVAINPVSQNEASKWSVMKRESDGEISSFIEKPKDAKIQQAFVSRSDPEKPFLGSVGIYLFNKKVLLDFLNDPRYEDIGVDIIPAAIKNRLVYGFELKHYEKIWSVRSYYEFNLALRDLNLAKNLFGLKSSGVNSKHPLGSSIVKSNLDDVLIGNGCCIDNANIKCSSIGDRTKINYGTEIKDSIILGADYYEYSLKKETDLALGIGKNCLIEGVIIDKNARIGDDVVIKPFPSGVNLDADSWYVRDGIVVVPKNGILRPNTQIMP